MPKQLNLFAVFMLLVMTGLLSRSMAMAQGSDDGAVAKVTISATTITWESRVGGDGIVLSVIGPDGYSFEQEYPGGQNPTFVFSDKADGAYTYQLTTVPVIDEQVRAVMEAVTEENRSAVEQQLRDAGKLSEVQTQAGAFYVAGGAVVSNDSDVLDPDKDIVHLDDVIIQYSQCVGMDCVNGENFGFDTVRLKENNLRIHFQDTSSSASFPSNDWRIVANDSSSGGANYLAIEDSTAGRIPFRVEAGAPANTLYVEADGDVGIKTANPVVDVHVVEGNTPTMRLEQDGSDGFTAQTWDVAGNEANFFIRDATNGSRLVFRIRPGAPESSIDIAGDGDVGVGTSSPAADLHVRRTDANLTNLTVQNTNAGDADVAVTMQTDGEAFSLGIDDSDGVFKLAANATPDWTSPLISATSDGYVGVGTGSPQRALHVVGSNGAVPNFPASLVATDNFVIENNGVSNMALVSGTTNASGIKFFRSGTDTPQGLISYLHSQNKLRFFTSGAETMTLDSSGNLAIDGALTQNSDVNAKDSFTPVDSQAVLDKLAQLPISTWRYKNDSSGSLHMGPMAQDFYAAFELGQDNQHIAPLDTSGAAIAAIQALYQLSREQEARIADLEQENTRLESRLDALEKMVNTIIDQQ